MNMKTELLRQIIREEVRRTIAQKRRLNENLNYTIKSLTDVDTEDISYDSIVTDGPGEDAWIESASFVPGVNQGRELTDDELEIINDDYETTMELINAKRVGMRNRKI
jgi:hypothetical protein